MENKKPYLSKTLIVSALMGILALIPGVQAFVAANPQIVMFATSLIFGGLRFITKGAISFED